MNEHLNKQETSNIPKPPEPQFFDKLTKKEERRFLLSDFLSLARVRWSLVALVPLLLFLFIFLPKGAKREPVKMSVPEETREVVTQEAMEQAIERTSKPPLPSIDRKEKELSRRERRNFKTQMAVFVFKKEGPKLTRNHRLYRNREEPLGLPAGTRVPAVLLHQIFSFNTEAPVLAEVVKDFKQEEKVLIPEGSRFLGEAGVLKSLDRVNVRFDLLILPNGRELRVRAMALSEDGSGGIRGKVRNHRDMKILKAIGEGVLGGVSLFLGGRRQDPYSFDDQLRLNVAENLTDVAARDLRRVKVEKSVTVKAGIPIQVILLEAI